MNDRRYEILIDGELLVDPISQLTADVTVVSEYNCITDYLETLRLGDMDIPLRGRPMISARGGVMRLGKHIVEIREKLSIAACSDFPIAQTNQKVFKQIHPEAQFQIQGGKHGKPSYLDLRIGYLDPRSGDRKSTRLNSSN